jgi:hypothetical protein
MVTATSGGSPVLMLRTGLWSHYIKPPTLTPTVMVIVASIYLRFYIKVRVGVGTFLPTPILTPPKIPSDPDSTAVVKRQSVFVKYHLI